MSGSDASAETRTGAGSVPSAPRAPKEARKADCSVADAVVVQPCAVQSSEQSALCVCTVVSPTTGGTSAGVTT